VDGSFKATVSIRDDADAPLEEWLTLRLETCFTRVFPPPFDDRVLKVLVGISSSMSLRPLSSESVRSMNSGGMKNSGMDTGSSQVTGAAGELGEVEDATTTT
jgi:hypothetical protein